VYRLENASQSVENLELDPFASPYRPLDRRAAVTPAAVNEFSQWPLSFSETVADLETRLLHAALEQARHNQKKAAELLGLSYHQLRGLLRKYRIET
jgi:psp operon transcriptional activator